MREEKEGRLREEKEGRLRGEKEGRDAERAEGREAERGEGREAQRGERREAERGERREDTSRKIRKRASIDTLANSFMCQARVLHNDYMRRYGSYMYVHKITHSLRKLIIAESAIVLTQKQGIP